MARYCRSISSGPLSYSSTTSSSFHRVESQLKQVITDEFPCFNSDNVWVSEKILAQSSFPYIFWIVFQIVFESSVDGSRATTSGVKQFLIHIRMSWLHLRQCRRNQSLDGKGTVLSRNLSLSFMIKARRKSQAQVL